jgi:predicted nucleotidyltransferase
VKSSQETFAVVRREKPRLAERYRVRRLALFGSYARGQQNAASDVDILVDVDPTMGLRLVSLAEELEDLLGEPVELVSVRALSPRGWEVVKPDLVDV